MTVADLITQIRRAINDVGAIEYTDDELVDYINQAQDYITNTCINHQYKGFLKSITLTLTDGKVTLPSDFVVESAVLSGNRNCLPVAPGEQTKQNSYTYKIIGNELYSDQSELTLIYYSYPSSYTQTTDTISLPNHFINLLKEISIYLALNRNEFDTRLEQQLSALYEQKLLKLISNYGLSTIPLNMPFMV